MEKFEDLRLKAKRHLKLADHMLFVTYPLLSEPKLLLTVVDNLFLSITNMLGAFLYHEYYNKRISGFEDTFEGKFNKFKLECISRYNLDKDYILFIQDIKDIIVKHKTSPVEFARKDRFVICSKDYKIKEITADKLRQYVIKSKEFINMLDELIKNGRVNA